MHLRRKLTVVAIAMVALCVSAVAASAEDGRSFTLRVDTPPVVAIPQADGLSELRIGNFQTHTATLGAPDVPSRTVLVALPPGASPRLEVRLVGARGFRNLVPRPLPRTIVDSGLVAAEGLARREDRQPTGFADRYLRPRYELRAEHYEGQGSFPSRVAWLGARGVLRDQHYVELHLAPVRYDRELGGLLVDSGLEVTVHFDGGYELAAAPADDAHFESIYRGAFANYDQGRLFRIVDELQPTLPGLPAQPTGGGVGPLRRIRVDADGPLRLDHGLIQAEALELLATDPRNWRVMNRGVQVPLHLHQTGGDDGVLEAGEWVQFYGQALDDEPPTELNHEQPGQEIANLYAVQDFSDENVYFLVVDASPQPQMASLDATPTGGGTPAPHFLETTHVESEDFYFPVPDALWFWLPFTSQTSGPRTETVPLPGLVSGTESLQIRLGVRGFLDCPGVNPDKKTLVRLRNDLAQTLVLPAGPDNSGNTNVGVFDGNTLHVHDFDWTHGAGQPEASDPLHVVLDADDLPGGCPEGGVLNENILDSIEVDYRRAFVAAGDLLEFAYPDGDSLIEVSGFTSGPIDVYEISATIGGGEVTDARRLTGVAVLPDGSGGFKARFEINDLGSAQDRRFVAATSAGVTLPAAADFQADRVSTILSDDTQADMVVIAHPDLIDSACTESSNICAYDTDCTGSDGDRCEITTGSSLDLLLAHRASQGISSRVVRLQDVYDEFNFGLEGPTAIRSFAAWLLAGGWDGGGGGDPPAWMLVLGDGSYDYKAGPANGNYVPTQMMVKNGGEGAASILSYYSSDNQLVAAAGGDQLADITIGRLPARDISQADTMLDRVRLHETTPGSGPWNERVLLISDRGADDDQSGAEAAGFESMNSNAASYLEGTNYTVAELRYWSDNCLVPPAGCDAGQMLQDILDEINALDRGAAIVQFTGHGNFDLWSNDVIFCTNPSLPYDNCNVDDTTLLTNFDRLPLLIVHNCLTGGFHGTGATQFGEQWLKRTTGGAFAVLAPSGLGFQFTGNALINVVWPDIFGAHQERVVGAAAMTGHVQLCTQGSIEPCQFYTLLGDPASRLGLPHVDAVDNLVATASTGVDAEVELSWDPSETPGATYDVYRLQVLAENQYTKINTGPVATAAYTDDTVEHIRTYLYYVVARVGGFDSAWSNFNSDCGETPGPDCVQATPLNLVPPATPSGVAAVDTETGGALTVSWNLNPEVDIQRYVVHFGTTAALGQSIEVLAGFNHKTLQGLLNGTPYHVAVQARNTSGTESLNSNPAVIATPNLVLGVKAPQFVDDLLLGKSGTDAVLSWGAITTDIYDKPIAIASYEVYRGAEAQFLPAPGNRIAVVGGTSYTDPGALTGGADYHYLVRAVDAAGNPGGLGHQLPQGILDLSLQPAESPPGAIFLEWTPVITDFDGGSAAISHYEIWAWDAPFTRAEIEAGSVDLLVPNASGPAAQILPPGTDRYYSVLAVDFRGNRSPF